MAINWDKLVGISQGILSTITNIASTGLSDNSASTIIPAATMTNLGIPLAGSVATRFVIGFIKG